jgi:TIR domain
VSLDGSETRDGREVFLSYRRMDDESPPDTPSVDGFVRYLLKQLRWELRQLGFPETVLWLDRTKIAPGDIWTEAIFKALDKAELFVAILSRNYMKSPWCEKELCAMLTKANEHRWEGRIFRVDKHSFSDHEIPERVREALIEI